MKLATKSCVPAGQFHIYGVGPSQSEAGEDRLLSPTCPLRGFGLGGRTFPIGVSPTPAPWRLPPKPSWDEEWAWRESNISHFSMSNSEIRLPCSRRRKRVVSCES